MNLNIKIELTSRNDFLEIERLAKSFDLDWEDASYGQFLVAKKENQIIGFGRLRVYETCAEIATVGVIQPERNKGIGTALVRELIRYGPDEVFVTCVIPRFFARIGFFPVKQYPAVLQKKVEFCKLYNFAEEQIFVMKHVK
jgi:N-acetylglutamate synthase-like GNAT family acetyltransferase